MSYTGTATKTKTKVVSEDITYGIIFTPELVGAEVLSSVSSVTVTRESTTSTDATITDGNLTVGTGTVNGATFTDDNGSTVAIGHAVQVSLSDGTAGVTYQIDAVAATDASNTRTQRVVLHVI